jgi:IS6 family transposase
VDIRTAPDLLKRLPASPESRFLLGSTDRAATYLVVLEDLLAAAWHRTEQHANNRVEADHGRLKSRLRPMRGLKQDRSARVIIAGHAFVQNLRRGHYELAVEVPAGQRLTVAFDDLALAI